MKRLKMIGLALVALCALGASSAPVVMAVEEGFLSPEHFSVETEKSVKPTIENEKGEKLACNTMSISEVQVENAHHGKGLLKLSGCKAEGLVPVMTLGDEKEILLMPILYLLCLISSTTLLFGIWIEPTDTVHVEIPSIKQLLLVKGAVIGHILSGNGPTKLFLVDLTGEKGKQTVATHCLDASGMEEHHTLEDAKDSEAQDSHASENAQFNITFTNNITLTD